MRRELDVKQQCAVRIEDSVEDFLEPGDQEYFNYEKPELSKEIRPRYAKTALALNGNNGEHSHVGKAMGYALLVREVRFENGEHEIWQQAFEWQNRFPSFAEYFSEVRRTIVESVRPMHSSRLRNRLVAQINLP